MLCVEQRQTPKFANLRFTVVQLDDTNFFAEIENSFVAYDAEQLDVKEEVASNVL